MIFAPEAAADLIDEITRLEARRDHLDPRGRDTIDRELEALRGVARDAFGDAEAYAGLRANLKAINTLLWNIENAERQRLAGQRFDEEFLRLNQSFSAFSQRRAAIKREINALYDCASEPYRLCPGISPTQTITDREP